MSGTVLLTLGRLPKALDLARGFAAAGARVVVAEPFGRHLTGVSRAVARSVAVPAPVAGAAAYLDALMAVVRREGVDLVVPVSEETVHVAGLVGCGVEVFTMPAARVLRLHSKAGFVAAAGAAGVAVPETWALGEAGAERLVAAGDVVVKPVFSCGGRGVRFVAWGGVLPEMGGAELGGRVVVQRRVRGAEFSTCTLAQGGRVISTVVYRATLMTGTVACAFERVEQPAVAAFAARMVAAEGWTGFLSFDLMVDEAGVVWGLECNPRCTSGVHFWDCADVARVVLGTGATVRFRPETRLQQFYSVLTETRREMWRGGWLGRVRGYGPDVSWSWRDPLPFLTMTWTAWPIIRLARARGVPFGEVATLDVGWYQTGTEADVGQEAG